MLTSSITCCVLLNQLLQLCHDGWAACAHDSLMTQHLAAAAAAQQPVAPAEAASTSAAMQESQWQAPVQHKSSSAWHRQGKQDWELAAQRTWHITCHITPSAAYDSIMSTYRGPNQSRNVSMVLNAMLLVVCCCCHHDIFRIRLFTAADMSTAAGQTRVRLVYLHHTADLPHLQSDPGTMEPAGRGHLQE